MKRILSTLCIALMVTASFAQGTHKVKGYTKKNGTYVAPHTAKNPTKKSHK